MPKLATEKVKSWENMIQTVASTVIVGLLAWSGINIVAVKENVAVLNTQMQQSMQMNTLQMQQVLQLSNKQMEHEGRITLLEHQMYEEKNNAK